MVIERWKVLRALNAIMAAFLVAIGIWRLVNVFLDFSVTSFFDIPYCFFIIFFGFMLVAAEFKKSIVETHFRFLLTFGGRGVFNLFICSFCVYKLSPKTNKTFSWFSFVFGMVMFVIGLFFIALHCCSVILFTVNCYIGLLMKINNIQNKSERLRDMKEELEQNDENYKPVQK